MIKVLCQLIAVVIIGEKALEKRQQLKGNKKWEIKMVVKAVKEEDEGIKMNTRTERRRTTGQQKTDTFYFAYSKSNKLGELLCMC